MARTSVHVRAKSANAFHAHGFLLHSQRRPGLLLVERRVVVHYMCVGPVHRGGGAVELQRLRVWALCGERILRLCCVPRGQGNDFLLVVVFALLPCAKIFVYIIFDEYTN